MEGWMPFFILAGVIFVFAVIFALYVRGVREKYIETIQRLRVQRRRKEIDMGDAQNDIAIRKENVKLLERHLETLRLEHEREKRRLAEEAAAGEERTALSVLESMGRVSQEDIDRAEEFRAKSGSEASIEEVLVLLEIVSPEEVQNAKATSRR
jgi:biopolymer transport protein ExbB/TolQ